MCYNGVTKHPWQLMELQTLLHEQTHGQAEERLPFACVTSYLTSLLLGVHARGAIFDSGFKVAATAGTPPNFLVGLGCILGRGACVALVVPLSSHLWKQRLEGVALASLQSHTAWASPHATQHAYVHVTYSRLPFVGLPCRALVTDPMGLLVAAASQLAGIQSCLLVQAPIPKLQHFMLTFCQCGMAFMLATLSDSCAVWTSCASTSALVGCCLPLTATCTLPPSLPIATGCELVRAGLVLLTPLRK